MLFNNYKLNFNEPRYTFLFQYSIVAWLVSGLLACISFFLVYQKPDSEKMSVYECGFILMVMRVISLKLILYCGYFIYYIWFGVCYIFPWAVSWWH
jgi:NADH:ubiquinone oxidoreductase subunit 3 (subunit A)